ncbi:ATP-binding cassette subfamily B protein [Melghirimyces profundicolus]|uniref:ATP-binding cassette subfamily B protein n=1 Tax=Melghirimyces profundicolus TaxID=1242148 RepID=A0A2T6C4R9_9BACL|nr:ABC transporter ATP-binding protein [Melghirimyces profundicolus]PTX63308.1 ATP-binding cassette subfamily B protein [Melghirimyces profundicolus]
MVMRRLLGYLKPHRKTLICAFILLLLATGAEVAGPLLAKIFIDDYLTPGIFPAKPLVFLGGAYLGLLLAGVVMQYFQQFTFHRIALRVIQQLRVDVFGKVQHLGLSFFDRMPGGALVSRITNDTEAVKELFVSVLSTFVQNLVLILGVFVALFLLNVELAAYCLVLLPLICGLMVVYRRLSHRAYREVRRKLSELNAKLSESIQGMNVIQALRQEGRLKREFGVTNREHYLANMQTTRLNGLLLRPAVDLIYLLTIMAVLTFFGIGMEESAVQIGVLYAFINLLDRMFEPVNQMMQQLSFLQQSLVSASRVFELLDEERLAPAREGSGNPEITRGRIVFDNVTFSYDGKTDVLKNISFTAEPGQTVALVGHTGSGKTSIINLLMRFYPLKKGRITIDGVPLERYRDDELRRKMGLVLQDPFLFVGTVEDNIRFHHPDLTDAEIREAARFVQADSFIEKLPKGYREPVGERGATFSSGQRQLLSFARTMALNPRILVLDEATAHVDTETEEKIQEALSRMRKGRTTIAIAHRLSTVQDADLILVLHRGEILERGTHQELLAHQGLYHKMYRLQQGMEESQTG